MVAGDEPIRVNYIGYEEALESIKKQTETRNAEIKAKNEIFSKKMESQRETTNILEKQQTTLNSYTSSSTKTNKGTQMSGIDIALGTFFMIIIFSLMCVKKPNKRRYYKKRKYNYNTKARQQIYNYNKQNTNVITNNYNTNCAFEKKSCLTQTELFFYRHLKKMIKEEYKIDPQIVISSIIETKNDNDYSNWNKINKKTVDFVIRNENLETILAIELDDYSHTQAKRIERDNFVNAVFADAGIPLIHIKTNTSYEKEIKTKMPEYLLKE